MIMAGRKQVQSVLDTQLKLAEAVESISKKLEPNGGTSVFDIIKANQRTANENGSLLKALSEAVTTIRAYQWSFAETLTDKPVYETDENGHCTRVNTAYSKLAERNSSELSGAGWENFVYPADRNRVTDEWADAVQRRRIFEGQYRVISRSGRIYDVKAIAIPIIDELGKLAAFVGRFDKVTEIEPKQN
jgi:PAS domain S-box-containing protein